ncbi:Putative oxidoreductase YteT precursor [Stieleria maiorica]|uniref:Oxidoreductase YteT n=1 Tax=Stieleria maiorica TaxID=2795974 RepID=A0A5B9MH97_9BACT|nr:Gfo/Idh/MocA family oxidoreductase [Stieleria maiorica]QEG00274.1 Putative oxidoreductase YteT precursor [Stieleria maiorica]
MDRRQFAVTSASLLAAASAQSATAQDSPVSFPVAVIGHTGRGDYGHGLDTVWKRIPETPILAVADANASGRAKALKKLALDDHAGYADYREMLAKVSPSIVAVCPRHVDQHRDMILASIEAGAKGIYVEKPFVRTPREADEILAACAKHGAKVAVAHRNRYHPVLDVIADLIRQEQIGRVLEIRGRGKGDRRGGGEDLWVLGSHVLNMITALAGKPQSCSAVLLQDGRRVTKQDVREGAEGLGPLAGNELHARFLFDHGVTVYFDSIANDGTANHGFGLQIIGSKGTIAIYADRTPLAYLVPGNPFERHDSPSRWLPITSGGVDVPEPNPALIHRVQHHDVAASDLIQAIREDREPLCNAAEAAWTVEMICGVFESHRQHGAAVTFPLQQRDHPLLRL